MASPLNSGPPDRISRLAQEREFHKHYIFGPTGPDLGDYSSTAPTLDKYGHPVAQCSHDTALTAFAQLGALRLDARRAMISLFDRSHQHVLAEATRTLSLQTGLPDTEDDSLWFGTKSLPREYGICTHVMDLLPRLPTGGGDIPRESTLIVPNVKEDVRFQNVGMVMDYSNTRFYAGVPIVSPKGIVIGTFSVMDDRPREALNPALIAFVAAMSKTVMNHLSLAQSMETSRRGELMIDGIGSFIEGKATLRGAAREARLARIATHPEDDTVEGHLDPQQQAILNDGQAHEDRDTMSGDFPLPANQGRPIERLLHEKSTEKVKTSNNGPADSKQESESSSNDVHSSEPTGPFSRASNIIRESMQVEGLAFFDASLKSYGGPPQNSSSDTENLSTSRGCSSEDCSDSSVTPADTTGGLPEPTMDPNGVPACEVFGFSTTVGSSINHDPSGARNFVMPEKLLRALLRRYPRGKILNFDEAGSISSGETSDGSSRQSSEPLEQQGDADKILRTSRKKNTREARRRAEASDIAQIFTGARSIVFLPLWDSRRSRWFSGIIAWTRMPQRIFNVAPDLLFLQAFGNNLMAEIHRLDIETANNQHATLISSISHELRSPLHGILGSSELLRDAPLNLMQRDMIQTMESCGQTLLDIINHLLDFAKINQSNINQSARDLTVHRKHGSKSRKHLTSALKRRQSTKKIPGTVRPSTSTPQVDLGVITEEVVDAVYAGHCFQRMPKFQFHTLDTVRSAKDRLSSNHIANTGEGNNVAIILDIDQSVNWNMRMEPGAWRRILMNIFGNSLKHTNTGFIHVKLGYSSMVPTKRGKREQKSSREKDQEDTRSCIRLTVRDTGRGISQEYLNNHLYTPFSQENPLLPGNGLGLSIVQHTVQSLGGSIDIQSTGETGCDVSVQIDADPPSPRINLKSPFCAQAHDSPRSKSLGLIRFNSPADPEHDAPSLVDNSLTTMCQKSLGIEVKTLDLSQEAFEACDYYFLAQLGSSTLQDLATQMCVVNEKRKQHGCLQKPLIVLCTTLCHAQELLAVAQGIDEGAAMEVISQPCGPRKFLKTLELCAAQSAAHTQRSDSASSDQLSSEPLTTPEPDQMIQTVLGPDEDESYMTLQQKDKDEAREPKILAARPRVIPEQEKQDQVAPVTPETEKLSDGADPEFMIVDDNEINQKLLAAFLKRQNCSYKTADNGLDALVAFQANPRAFKAVFMDITMPVMDGLTAIREIRRVEQEHIATLDDTAKSSWRPVAIVAVTGLGSPVIQQDALSAGVDLFLTRPVRFSHLREIVESIGDS